MEKVWNKVIIGAILFLFVFVVGFQFAGDKTDRSNMIYLEYFNGEDSDIRIDCEENIDCKILDVDFGCGGYMGVNVANSNNEWRKFNLKSQEIEEELGIIYDCIAPSELEAYEAICNSGVCVLIE
jgi:hypothetical protein